MLMGPNVSVAKHQIGKTDHMALCGIFRAAAVLVYFLINSSFKCHGSREVVESLYDHCRRYQNRSVVHVVNSQ